MTTGSRDQSKAGVLALLQGLAFGLLISSFSVVVVLAAFGEFPTVRSVGLITSGQGTGASAPLKMSLVVCVTLCFLAAPIFWQPSKPRADSRTASAALFVSGAILLVSRDPSGWAMVAAPATVVALALLAVRWRQHMGEPMLYADRSPTPHLAASLVLAVAYGALLALPVFGVPLPGIDLFG